MDKAAYMRIWNAAHPKELAAYNQAYLENHREERAAYHRMNHEAHREERTARMRDWSTSHPEAGAAYQRKYYKGHREEVAAKHSKRRARKRGNGGSHTAQDVLDLLEAQEGKCAYCGVDITEEYHVDHVIPISRGGSDNVTNLKIACPTCNLKKGPRLPL